MLTKLLLQDETTASLGKTEHDFIIDVWGKKLTHVNQSASSSSSKLKNIRKLVRRDFFTFLRVPPIGG